MCMVRCVSAHNAIAMLTLFRGVAPPPVAAAATIWRPAWLPASRFGIQVGALRACAAAASAAAATAAASPPLAAPAAARRDTIFALSSGAGRSAVAVVRISGPAADDALRKLLPQAAQLPPPRTAKLTSLVAPDGSLLDRALVLRLIGPRSFTGEDCAELHLHGSPAVVQAVLETLAALQLRPAEAGEFSRRAFDAGKLDLTQLEGLADLLAAETESQRKQALLHSTGAVRRQHEQWRQTLLACLARLEAVIDFGEDEGIADDVAAGVLPVVGELRRQVEGHLATASSGELIRSGLRIAIVGPPNAGKSSLLNVLHGTNHAIVSPVAGTTRDTVSVQLELGGVKVILTDSAGLRRTDCPIEAEGVRRAMLAAQEAHIVLHVADAAAASSRAFGGPEVEQDEGAPELPLSPDARHMRILNKADLLDSLAAAAAAASLAQAGLSVAAEGGAGNVEEAKPATGKAVAATPAAADPAANPAADRAAAAAHMPVHLISCQTGAGIEQLVAALQQQALEMVRQGKDGSFSGALVTRPRHRHHLGEAVAAMQRYESAAAEIELACEELRAAGRSLGRVVGVIDTEEVLDSLFAEFCIGK